MKRSSYVPIWMDVCVCVVGCRRCCSARHVASRYSQMLSCGALEHHFLTLSRAQRCRSLSHRTKYSTLDNRTTLHTLVQHTHTRALFIYRNRTQPTHEHEPRHTHIHNDTFSVWRPYFVAPCSRVELWSVFVWARWPTTFNWCIRARLGLVRSAGESASETNSPSGRMSGFTRSSSGIGFYATECVEKYSSHADEVSGAVRVVFVCIWFVV